MTSTRSVWLRALGIGLVALASTVALATLAFFFMIHAAFPTCWASPDHFDAQEWRAADVDGDCNVRSGMVDDLLAGSELESGRPRAEVEQLLGPTEDTDDWLSENEGLVYVTSCWIDCNWLVIEFDPKGRLVRASTAQD